MKPLDVPITSEAATLRQVGRPKLRLPTSEKTWPVAFFSLVHRTTSHGACGVSAPSAACWKMSWLETEDWREWGDRNAGDEARGVASGEGERREEKRRSKGWSDVGRFGRREACETGTLLLGEDSREPCYRQPHPPSSWRNLLGSTASRRG
jgi:hypothetical protein